MATRLALVPCLVATVMSAGCKCNSVQDRWCEELRLTEVHSWELGTTSPPIKDCVVDFDSIVYCVSGQSSIHVFNSADGTHYEIANPLGGVMKARYDIESIERGPRGVFLLMYTYKDGDWHSAVASLIQDNERQTTGRIRTRIEPVEIAWNGASQELWYIGTDSSLNIIQLNNELDVIGEEEQIDGSFWDIKNVDANEMLVIERVKEEDKRNHDVISVFQGRKRTDFGKLDCEGCYIWGKDAEGRYLVAHDGTCMTAKYCEFGIHRFKQGTDKDIIGRHGITTGHFEQGMFVIFEWDKARRQTKGVLSLYELN